MTDVTFALAFCLKVAVHGLNVIMRPTQPNDSFAHFLYLAENIPRKPNTTITARQRDITIV